MAKHVHPIKSQNLRRLLFAFSSLLSTLLSSSHISSPHTFLIRFINWYKSRNTTAGNKIGNGIDDVTIYKWASPPHGCPDLAIHALIISLGRGDWQGVWPQLLISVLCFMRRNYEISTKVKEFSCVCVCVSLRKCACALPERRDLFFFFGNQLRRLESVRCGISVISAMHNQ